jgi:hypothetical protein
MNDSGQDPSLHSVGASSTYEDQDIPLSTLLFCTSVPLFASPFEAILIRERSKELDSGNNYTWNKCFLKILTA